MTRSKVWISHFPKIRKIGRQNDPKNWSKKVKLLGGYIFCVSGLILLIMFLYWFKINHCKKRMRIVFINNGDLRDLVQVYFSQNRPRISSLGSSGRRDSTVESTVYRILRVSRLEYYCLWSIDYGPYGMVGEALVKIKTNKATYGTEQIQGWFQIDILLYNIFCLVGQKYKPCDNWKVFTLLFDFLINQFSASAIKRF